MIKCCSLAVLMLGVLVPAAFAQRDFLTPDEVSKVREAQEPDVRLALYANFAQLRMELLRNYFSNTKAGRSALIHDTLEDYIKIIEAIDTVADDALRRNLTVDKGIAAVGRSSRRAQPASPACSRDPARPRTLCGPPALHRSPGQSPAGRRRADRAGSAARSSG